MKRQVWKISKAGSLGRLRLKEEELPALEAGQVQVGIKAIGLNFAVKCLNIGAS